MLFCRESETHTLFFYTLDLQYFFIIKIFTFSRKRIFLILASQQAATTREGESIKEDQDLRGVLQFMACFDSAPLTRSSHHIMSNTDYCRVCVCVVQNNVGAA